MFDIKNFKLGKFMKQFEEKNYLFEWYDAQPISAKIGFYGAAIFALLTHFIIYSTLILEEHLAGFTSYIRRDPRWFHGFVNRLNFNLINWVTGLMQALFLSMLVFLVVKAFGLKNKAYILLIAGLMVTFPVIAEINLHFHDAATYFFAAFVSMWAFYITKLYKFGWVIGSFLLMLGLATYQSKISVAMVACLIYLVLYILKEKPKFMDFAKYASRFFLLIVGGLAAYMASFELFDFTLGNYRGIGDVFSMGTLRNLPATIPRVYQEVYYYFFSTLYYHVVSFRIHSRLLILAYSLVFLVGMLSLVLAIINIRKNVQNVILACMLVLLLPLAANFSRLFDTGYVQVIKTSSYAFVFFLILPLILWDNIKINTFGIRKATCLVLVFIISHYVSFSNYIYLRGEVITRRFMHFSNRVSTRVEPLLPYSIDNQVFLMGNVVDNPLYPHLADFGMYIPRTTINRMWGNNYIYAGHAWPQDFISDVIRNRIGLNIVNVPDNDRKQYLLDRAITYGMPVWPMEGSISVVDGVVVGMLHFFGRVDVEQTCSNSFAATINHTGSAGSLEFEYAWYLYQEGQKLEQIHEDIDGNVQLSFAIDEPGSYQLRVFIRFRDGTSIIDCFSPIFEVK